MSAREEIHRLFESGRTSYRLDELLDALGTEVLRAAAEKIRDGSHHLLIQRDGKFYGGMHHSANLIDPDKED